MNEQVEYNTQELQEIQYSIELGNSLDRLMKNKDFKKIMVDSFLESGTKLLTTNLPVSQNREALVEQIAARGYLYRFFDNIANDAMNARLAIAELEE